MSSKSTSTVLGVLLAVVIVVLVVFRVTGVFPPVDKKAELVGTIGGVEKAEKFVGEQMTFEDVQFEDPESAKFVQSAEFQNLLRDPDFRRLVQDKDFNDWWESNVPRMDFQKLV